ncbi:MAG: 50S ribosomal protein L21, large subunit ribosomal protein L21 [Candidatus Peregrinibacteria bacterium GW2011_GWF2_33_10]|nr:MAG: 50S ribosomal protein L21, large subunit ribosomal protein L21 [Candidatus Peregrinibacteria bacterium GW2011_GWF2_33_10]OGJ43975.1 MAG: 50S ribosomal protein L21 [Candidatus Peregrinibacteria bacterium RIFOXYA12_FULL_33_12]OGJ45298.1 MAG: 50S ribosomal protein L21 [Candidatus Peregrinibacteria bacterium RIFOXYA2_FULL_33_21]OGJ49998.1 MAG: 50S ribosomal protein L21 [Candidatus Peregrinibacteria bacterium RIFOXYB2_FULL_33_20]
MFAVIKTGGKQYKVAEKDVLEIEKLNIVKSGDKVMIDKVLLISNDKEVKIGEPYIEGAGVELKILDNVKGEKIRAYTYEAKKRHQKTWGHRQMYSEVEVVKILATGHKSHKEGPKGENKGGKVTELKAVSQETVKEEVTEKKVEEKKEVKTIKKEVKKPAVKKSTK